MERVQITISGAGDDGVRLVTAPPGTNLVTLDGRALIISVPLPEREGTALDAWLLWCAAYSFGVGAAAAAFTMAAADNGWWPVAALVSVWWLGVAACYAFALPRRSKTIRALWRGLTGKKGVKI